MEEANKTARKVLGMRMKDWMDPWKQYRFMPKRKRQLDDQAILKSKIPKSQPLEYGSANRSDHGTNTAVSCHTKQTGSHLAIASRLDEGLQPKVVQEPKDSLASVRSSSVDITESSPARELSPSKPENSPGSNSVKISLTDQKQAHADPVKAVSRQSPNLKNKRTTARVVVPQQRASQQLICSTQSTLRESDSSLPNSVTSIVITKTSEKSPAEKDLSETGRTRQPCDSVGPTPSTTTDLVIRSPEGLLPPVMVQSNQNRQQLEPRTGSYNNYANHNKGVLNNGSRTATERIRPVIQGDTPNTRENSDGAVPAMCSPNGVNAQLLNTVSHSFPSPTVSVLSPTWAPTTPATPHNIARYPAPYPAFHGNRPTFNVMTPEQAQQLSVPTSQPSHRQLFTRPTVPLTLDTTPQAVRASQIPSPYRAMTQAGLSSREVPIGSPPSTNDNVAILTNQQSINHPGTSNHGQTGQSSPLFNRNIPIVPQSSQEQPNAIHMSELFYRRHLMLHYSMSPASLQFEEAIELPSLQEFINASGHSAGMIWKMILTRLQYRPSNISTVLNQFLYGGCPLRLPYDLQMVCNYQDGKYLLMLQTFAILRMPIAVGLVCDATLAPGLNRLEELFSDIGEKCILWFVNLPCACPSTEDSLQKWIQTLSPDLRAIGTHMDVLNRTCSLKRRLPLMSEIDTLFWASVGLTTVVFRSLLVRWFPPPRDDCFFKMLRCFAAGLSQKQDIIFNSPPSSHRHKIDLVRKSVDADIKACCRAHKKHMISTSGTPKSYSRTSILPCNVFQHSRGHSPISPTNFAPGNFHPPSTMHSPTTRMVQQTVPPQQIYSDPRNPRVTRLSQSLAFPTTNRPLHASEYGIPLHHAHLRDPITVQTSMNDKNDVYRAYVDDLDAAKSLTFTRKDMIKGKRFQIPEETFVLLARETLNTSGGPSTRAINTTSQIIRLRGAAINHKTSSEWYIAETHWPWSIAVLLNNRAIEFRRKPQYPKDLVVDVTSLIKQGRNDLLVSFLWSEPPPPDFHYTIALEHVKIVDIKVLRANIQSSKPESTEKQLKNYFENPTEDEVEMMLEHLDISLLDPFTSQMPNTPARSIHCKHFQCFDLDVFLESRPRDINKPDQFVCPICGKDARPGFLQIDGWMEQVLQKLRVNNRTGTKVIKVLPDLTWTVKEEIQVETPSESIDVLPAASESTSKVIEVIELD